MADIEERAEKWAREYIHGKDRAVDCLCAVEPDLIAAYLAGSAQTQGDYAKHYVGQCDCFSSGCSGCVGVPALTAPDPRDVGSCERHGKTGCAWCIPGPYEDCPRCVCTCGAR